MIQALRERRAAIGAQMKALLDDKQNPTWNADLQAKYDGMSAEVAQIDAQIKAHQDYLDRFAEEQGVHAAADAAGKKHGSQSAALYAKWLRGGDQALTAEDWQTVRATMSTTTPAEGGYTVPAELARSLIEAVKAFGGMREVATQITTETGAPMNWATTDDTSEEGEILAENAEAGNADPSFGTVGLNVFKFSSKVVTIPMELLQDSAVDLEAHINSRLAKRIARIQNRVFTTGNGITEPRGALTASSAGRVGATGQTLSVTFDDLLRLEHSVDPAYRSAASYMFHDSTLLALKLLKDGQNRPLWLPGLTAGDPDTIGRYRYTINQHMPVMAPNAKSILFGDFTAYMIRDALQLSLHRFTDSAYTKRGQVGFLAFQRSGGNYIDVGGGLKHYANSAT
ncbi:phage major capsid protein [Chitinibacteraceae bacterium HSL-7]